MTFQTARRRYRIFGLGIAGVLVALGALGYALTATFTSAAPTSDVAAATSSAVSNPQPAPAVAPSTQTPTPAPTPAAAPVPKAATDSAPGCAQRAMAAGKFNPGCAEYQGYLDPGRAAGRGPTSGEIQHANGCAQGYIPKSQC